MPAPRGLRQVWARVSRMSAHEIGVRLAQELNKHADAARARLGFAPLKQSLARNPQPPGRFFFDPADVPALVECLRARLPGEAGRIVRESEQICTRRFDLLGYSGARFRPRDRLAPRSSQRPPRAARALVPHPLPRFRRRGRPQDRLGTEPAPAPHNARQGLLVDGRKPLRRRASGAVARLASRQRLPVRHQLGQQPRGRLPQPRLDLDRPSPHAPRRG